MRFTGALLRERREQQGLSVEAVAQSVSRSARTLESYERGDDFPARVVLGRLANALHCTPDDFYEESDEPDGVAIKQAVLDEWVASLPPLTPRQREELTRLLGGTTDLPAG